MKNVVLIYPNGTRGALSNLCWRNDCSAVEIEDAAEDSVTAEDFEKNINKLNLIVKGWKIDRETASYVRLKQVDGMGNIKYLKAEK